MHHRLTLLLVAAAAHLTACEAVRAKVDVDALKQAVADVAGDIALTDTAPAPLPDTSDAAAEATATDTSAVDLAADLSALDAPADTALPETAPADIALADIVQPETALPETTLPDTATADTTLPSTDVAATDTTPCTGPTCKGAPYPAFVLEDFQPKSAGFKTQYGLQKFIGKVTVVALLAGW